MKPIAHSILLGMCPLLLAGTTVRAEDQVLTIYFCGTGMKNDAYAEANSGWGTPELIASMYEYADSSIRIEPHNPSAPLFFGWWEPVIDPLDPRSGPHYKYIVNGAGTSPEANIFDLLLQLFGQINPIIGIRNWENMKNEALWAVELVHQEHPSEEMIVNLVGFSRGGVSTLMVQRALYVGNYSYVKKVNILAYDPVPGGIDPVLSFGAAFSCSPKVNQYVALYAQHERTYQFEPILPVRDNPYSPTNPTGTRMLTVRVPGSHETMVGNRQIDGHAAYLGIPTFDAVNPGFQYVNDIAWAIGEQLLTSPEWGNVQFSAEATSTPGDPRPVDVPSSKDAFGARVSAMWNQDYQWIPWWPFIPAFGSYDACYMWTGRDHHLRVLWLTPVVHGRLCFLADEVHGEEWAWACLPWPVWFPNKEKVFGLDSLVPEITEDHWVTVQSFRGTPPPDSIAPVPDLVELPTITGQCSASITVPPTATDNVAGKITGTTTDPLSYSEQGTYVITWTYDDGNGNTATQEQMVVVEDTEPPYPDEEELPVLEGQCGVEITVIPTATDNCSGEVSGSTSDPLSYSEQGTYSVEWTYEDDYGNWTTQTQTVIVADTQPPVIESLVASPSSLWPPNHRMWEVEIDASVSDDCGEAAFSSVILVESNQPENGHGDGNTAPDWEITGDFSVNLRAERAGGDPGGRVYTITVESVDSVGNSATATVDVTVAHDQGPDDRPPATLRKTGRRRNR